MTSSCCSGRHQASYPPQNLNQSNYTPVNSSAIMNPVWPDQAMCPSSYPPNISGIYQRVPGPMPNMNCNSASPVNPSAIMDNITPDQPMCPSSYPPNYGGIFNSVRPRSPPWFHQKRNYMNPNTCCTSCQNCNKFPCVCKNPCQCPPCQQFCIYVPIVNPCNYCCHCVPQVLCPYCPRTCHVEGMASNCQSSVYTPTAKSCGMSQCSQCFPSPGQGFQYSGYSSPSGYNSSATSPGCCANCG